MNKKLESMKLQDKTIGIESFTLFRDIKDKSFPSPDSNRGKKEIHDAEEILKKDFPILPASAYMRFLSDGNRNEFESLYFNRRSAVKTLTAAECIEKKGRFVSKIIDVIWTILEETTWVISAHNISQDRKTNANLPDCYKNNAWYIDLFSAETAATIAISYYFLKDDIKKSGGELVLDRLVYEIDKRIIKPFFATNEMFWMGFISDWVNNWNPWIISNILMASALTVCDIQMRKNIVKRCCICLDKFISGYYADGGCDEGPHYWGAAGGALFDCLEILYDLTDGKADLFSDKDLLHIMEFIYKVHINNRYFITFGDAHARTNVEGDFYRRIGRRFGSDIMEGFGQEMFDKFGHDTSVHRPGRFFKNLLDTEPSDKKYTSSLFMALPDMQLCAMRENNISDKGFYFWIKGGHNNESHNHNDIGSIGLYLDGKPLMIDIGIGEYTRFTFSELRYTQFPIKTYDHTLPIIGGKGQHEGADYKTDFFEIDETSNTVKAGLASAYENKADIISFTRTASMNSGIVTLCDDIRLKSEQEVLFNFYLINKPFVISDGIIDIGGGAVMEYNGSLNTGIEEIVFTDKQLAKDWEHDSIYRLSFTTIGKVNAVKAEFIIKH